jgi:proteasome lid subunit RPN8/RPN11
MNRGEWDHVPVNIIVRTYEEAIDKIVDRKQLKTPVLETKRVYAIHSHPDMDMKPSGADFQTFKQFKQFKYFDVISEGFGILTKKGLFIWKLPENHSKLNQLPNAEEYNKNTMEIFDKLEKTLMGNPSNVEHVKRTAFKKLQEEHPSIKSRTIRRTHARNAGVRR